MRSEVRILYRPQRVFELWAVKKLWESFCEDSKTFDSFMERLREQKTEKVYRNCKFRILYRQQRPKQNTWMFRSKIFLAKNKKVSPLFEKNYKKLSTKIKNESKGKEEIFRENPFHQILKTHKLSGKEKEVWAFWINHSYRIKFIFLGGGRVLFLDIGTHDIYK